jgi:hypothetical protein
VIRVQEQVAKPRRFPLSVSSESSVVVAAFEVIGLRLRIVRIYSLSSPSPSLSPLRLGVSALIPQVCWRGRVEEVRSEESNMP